jgi:metal-responsive CopG/Arc/MetJ family transcriptional regulator
MESITIRVDDGLAKKMEKVLAPYYTTKTELIREAIREKVKHLEDEKVLRDIQKRAMQKSFKELSKEERRKLFNSFAKGSKTLGKFDLEGVPVVDKIG